MRLGLNLLQMPMVRLKEYVEQQIEENPLLEAEGIEPSREDAPEIEDFEGDEEFEANPDLEAEERRNYKESLISKTPALQEHLLKQLHLLVDFEKDLETGEAIVGNINDDGYLECSIEEIAESVQATPDEAGKVLSLVQTFDPLGVGARDLRECLLLQINPVRSPLHPSLNNLASNGVKPHAEERSLAGQIIDKYLPYLEKKRFNYIAKELGASVEMVKEAMKKIAALEPKPGRLFNSERALRLIPDVILRKEEDSYKVIFNDDELPRITLNEKYKKMIRQKGAPEDAKEYLKERLRAAQSLIEAIAKRKETIRRVTEEIACIQKDFLDNGSGGLKSMTLDEIAKRIGKHKSTVSRAIANKYLQTPYGIVELRSFLNYGIKQENKEALSSKAVKARIKALIENEDKEKPLSDQAIVNLLKGDGLSLSRRVIVKYRKQLKILSSKSRRG